MDSWSIFQNIALTRKRNSIVRGKAKRASFCAQNDPYFARKMKANLLKQWEQHRCHFARKIGDVLRAKWGPFCFGNTGKLALVILVKIKSYFSTIRFVCSATFGWHRSLQMIFKNDHFAFNIFLELFIVLYADIRIHSFWKKLK